MTLTKTLEQLEQEHKGKRIEMVNRFGYWWNYRNEEVDEIRITNKHIYITMK